MHEKDINMHSFFHTAICIIMILSIIKAGSHLLIHEPNFPEQLSLLVLPNITDNTGTKCNTNKLDSHGIHIYDPKPS